MATPATSVREFCTLLAKSKLLPVEEVRSLKDKWQAETGSGDDQAEAFGKYLAGKRVLTPWQSAMVLRGRADGFFLEGYKILDQIGKGQMGGVYKAVHSLGQTVALKILPASRAKDPRVLSRFKREARLLTLLDHANVVRAFQVGDSGGRHFIAMEFLEGETLDEVLARRKNLPVAESVRLVRQALDGLQHLHEKRMVHRDLKPSNLMIVPGASKGDTDTTLDATVKILDIGLGREMFAETDSDEQTATQLTIEGAVVGTPDYMSPEQAKDARSSDIRADVYSLGCVLYHCLTGRPPFTDSNIMTQMLKHATEAPQPLASFIPDSTAALQAVLDRMMAKSPAERYSSPAEAAKALRDFESTGTTAARVEVVPAYRKWLETESVDTRGLAGTGDSQSAGKSGTGSHRTAAVKPGTAAQPAMAAQKPKSAPVPRPTPPVASPYSAPAAPQWGKPQPVLPLEEEVEVELVAMPAPGPRAEPLIEPLPDERGLLELNRRDLIMLIGGGTGVIGALGVGYGLARLLRGLKSSPAETGTDEKKE